MSIIGIFPYSSYGMKHIPASIAFSATAGENTLHLRPQTGGFNCTIHWGDGTTTKAPANGGNVIHSYAIAKVYNIQIKGKSFAGFYVNNQAGKEKYIAAYSMGQWAVDTMTSCERSFYGCSNLKTIPADLFRYNTAATAFNYCFQSCNALTSIPADLFWYNAAATTFYYCFYGCSALTSIPADLFRYNTAATDFRSCFQNCSALTSIPVDLFRYNTAATNFIYCFYGCSALTTIPADLFRYNTAATNFSSCFSDCSTLTSIPADLFSYNTAVTDFSHCFQRCSALTLRLDIFGTDYANRFSGKTVNFMSCFNRTSFTGAQGTAPELWRFSGLTATKTGCFGGAGNSATSLSNYASIPAEWK